jgi:hypothetical protein
MKLLSDNNNFELTVQGYEFPNSNDRYDANWLKIEMKATTGEMSWRAVESCLRTFELVELKDWFTCIATGDTKNKSIEFTENELSFRLKNQDELLVVLDFAFHPNGSSYDYDSDKQYLISFNLNEVNINDILKFLSQCIEKYPERVKQ